MSAGQQIRRARTERGWTREMLAVMTGVSATTIGRVERGSGRPRPSVLIALARGLNLPIKDLAESVGLVINTEALGDS